MTRLSNSPLYVFVTGGVMSSLGKGIVSAALGALMKARGARVRLCKLEPYLNVDPGTMSPYQHGEVFVTDDGAEADLDLGHYERFADVNAQRKDFITTGQLYSMVIEKERRGDYLGQTVQIVPHITNQIKELILSHSDQKDIVICEIGGTVGDIEGLPFLEAIRQIRQDLGPHNTLFVHLGFIPYLENLKELKTKPIQHSVKELQRGGIQPDILVCRCDQPIPEDVRQKIALFCNIPDVSCVIEAKTVDNIYTVPLVYHQAGLDAAVCRLRPQFSDIQLQEWQDLVFCIQNVTKEARIALIAKYTKVPDAYKSVIEALMHAGLSHALKLKIDLISAERLEDDPEAALAELSDYDGILVPGGFGYRGAEGKIRAIRYARENRVPFLGICFGMQLAVIESARSLAGLPFANSSEFGETADPVIGLLTEWMSDDHWKKYQVDAGMGGTMRLGAFPCALKEGSQIAKLYGQNIIHERHRHRYEVNSGYLQSLEKTGMVFSGTAAFGWLVETIERPDHPFFIAVQFHPEFKSRPLNPHPLFLGFVEAAKDYSDQKKEAVV